MTRGFFTIALGEEYHRLAYALALSLKITQPEEYSKLSIGVSLKEKANINPKYLDVFDQVIEIPWGDLSATKKWKFENEWKSIHMTPYDETIKLDADMIFTSDISEWWKYLSLSEGVFATDVKTYRNETITSDICRKVFTDNNLPNVYSAFFYFKRSNSNFEFFKLVEDIFKNWEHYFQEFFDVKNRPTFVSTDVVFALASKISNYDECNNFKVSGFPTFVHMKTELQKWVKASNDPWIEQVEYFYNNDCQLTIENYIQTLPFHYQIKEFMTDDIILKMENKLGIK